MNFQIIFLVLISVFTAAVSAEVICGPDDALLSNPVDCGSFYLCSNGVPYLQQCAPTHGVALVFDPNLNLCVWATDYDCTESETTTNSPASTMEPSESTKEPAESTMEPSESTKEPSESTKEPSESTKEPSEPTPSEPPCHEISHPTTCQGSPHNCSFCFDTYFSDGTVDMPRCDTYNNLLEGGCHSFDVNRTEYDSVVVTNPNCTTWLPVEPGRKRNISVTFSLEKHPLDLYYLMDFSGSMADDKANVVKLSSSLLELLANLTDDFRIGFGTFVDKPILPFGGPEDYSFRNDFPITSETAGLVQKINDLPILGGKDGPESHADALAQVIECAEQIGWRSNSRRVVLLATDIDFHIAGDGRAANITAPYVEGCYMDSFGSYTEELTMDYPSIEQLANAYSKNQATTTAIFATSSKTVTFYEQVASQFKSAYVGALNSDSSNVLELIRNEFAKIESRMEIEKSDTSESVSFKYFSNCMRSDDERETTVCEHLPNSGDVTFVVEIDLAECPKDGDETGMMFDLNPVGLPIFIEVELSYLCD
ncbi:integrin beta-PS-like [Bradysia coprophila]|uniref:integrin beta-PS-like n=1 Tax=Bradysia coprophila TaxID=38358 RepID=UPI00187D881E|nr:integrin beta-PS-like [Bradysia coprophila]